MIASYENDQAIRGAGNTSSQKVYTYVDKGILINGNTYWYKLIDVDVNGVRTEHPVISAVPHVSSADLDVVDNGNLPKEFRLIAGELDANLTVAEIGEESSLFEDGLGLDSVAIVEFITILEDRFQVQFSDLDLTRDMFRNISTIADFVVEKAS